jgi:hypothetical protein
VTTLEAADPLARLLAAALRRTDDEQVKRWFRELLADDLAGETVDVVAART